MYIEKLDNTRTTITPTMAMKLKLAWAGRRKTKLSKEQEQYLGTIKQIVYGPDQHFCFCRYELQRTIPMQYSKLYVLQCPSCKKRYTTDVDPNLSTPL